MGPVANKGIVFNRFSTGFLQTCIINGVMVGFFVGNLPVIHEGNPPISFLGKRAGRFGRGINKPKIISGKDVGKWKSDFQKIAGSLGGRLLFFSA
jgi:hypothetical protein